MIGYRFCLLFAWGWWLSTLCLPSSAPSEESGNQTVSGVPAQDTLTSFPVGDIALSHQFLIEASESLWLAPEVRPLTQSAEYTIDYRYGTIVLDSLMRQSLLTNPGVTVIARYRFLPFNFPSRFSRRDLILLPETRAHDTLRVAQPRLRFSVDDIFGPGLQKSGSIVRGITVGSNRDFSVNSGLRLQLSGKLLSDVDIAASLTDENTPIQPEGTTQTLQEFDKVVVEVQGPGFNSVLGDFDLALSGTEFGRLDRKLQGAKGTVMYGSPMSNGQLTLSAAAPRGRFASKQLQGIEGVQGPYLLSGLNGERRIIVVAGTEKVFVNGELMARGETKDYTIDYSVGEVTFTSRRLITDASRIVVDFEYSDRQYTRSFFGTQSTVSLFSERMKVGFSFLREADDKDETIDLVLNDSTKQVLSTAGDDAQLAFISGVTKIDSNGFYIQIDTTISGEPIRFYRYLPGPMAEYVVVFTFVGAGKGEYVRQQGGGFLWKGTGQGEYLPVRRLATPQSNHLLDYLLEATPTKDLLIKAEFAQSDFDANLFSPLDEDDNHGHAFTVSSAYFPKDVSLGGVRVGSFEFRLKERFIQANFVPIDRINLIEFGRYWGVDSVSKGSEETLEGSLRYSPIPFVNVTAGAGKFRKGDAVRSSRSDAAFSLSSPTLPGISYTLERIESENASPGVTGSWTRQRGSADHRFGRVTPTFRMELEERNLIGSVNNSLIPGSFRFDVFAPGVKLTDLGPVELFSEFEWRRDDKLDTASSLIAREANSFTQSYHGLMGGLPDFSTSIDLTLRNKDVSPTFAGMGEIDVKTVLIRNSTRYSPLNRGLDTDLFYEVATERSSRPQRVFVRVAPGSGNYLYLGDINGNGIADEAEFELARYDGEFTATTTSTEALFPIIDLKTSARLRVTPRLFLPADGNFMRDLSSALSTETYIRVDEKSREPDLSQIYLLHFSRFLNDSTTISGSNLFTQDINIFEQRTDFSMRWRFSQRKSLTGYSGGLEHGYVREQSVRIRAQLVKEVSQQVDLVRRTDTSTNRQIPGRTHNILANTIFCDFSYRPEQRIEIGLRIEVTGSTDRNPESPADADINAQAIRGIYSLQGLGQIRGELTREEVIASSSMVSLPFELTGGRVLGRTWLWKGAADYRMAQFVQATLSYDGRSEAGRPVVHTGRAEVRAFF